MAYARAGSRKWPRKGIDREGPADWQECFLEENMTEREKSLGELAKDHYFKEWCRRMESELGPNWVRLWVEAMD